MLFPWAARFVAEVGSQLFEKRQVQKSGGLVLAVSEEVWDLLSRKLMDTPMRLKLEHEIGGNRMLVSCSGQDVPGSCARVSLRNDLGDLSVWSSQGDPFKEEDTGTI